MEFEEDELLAIYEEARLWEERELWQDTKEVCVTLVQALYLIVCSYASLLFE